MSTTIETPEVTPAKTVLDENWPVIEEDPPEEICHLYESGNKYLCGVSLAIGTCYFIPAHAQIVDGFGDSPVCDQGHRRCWGCVTKYRRRSK